MTTTSKPAATLAEAVARATGELKPLLGDEARREAETLVLTCLHLPRSVLITDPARPLDAAEAVRLEGWTERRADGEPLAYLTGEREFWSLPFSVSPAVLVPRPETELLVERALQAGDAWCAARRVTEPSAPALEALDLGTGSGAIALTLAAARPAWRLTAVDRSPEALSVARANAATGANTVTITNAASNNNINGNAVVAVTSSAQFRTYKTATNTFATYRIS